MPSAANIPAYPRQVTRMACCNHTPPITAHMVFPAVVEQADFTEAARPSKSMSSPRISLRP